MNNHFAHSAASVTDAGAAWLPPVGSGRARRSIPA